MITKAHRFHGFTSLRPVYARGQTVRGPAMAVKYLANPRRSSYRAAVVVSRKVHKSAVVRNRIRRRLYEIIRSLEPRFAQPYDMVVTVYSDQVAAMPAEELQSNLAAQLKKAGVLAQRTGGRSHGGGTGGPEGMGRAIVEPQE